MKEVVRGASVPRYLVVSMRVVYVVLVVGAHGVGQHGARQQQQEAASTRGNETHARSKCLLLHTDMSYKTYEITDLLAFSDNELSQIFENLLVQIKNTVVPNLILKSFEI